MNIFSIWRSYFYMLNFAIKVLIYYGVPYELTITKTLIVDINLNGEQLNNYYNCTPTIYVDTSERPGVEIIYAENLTIQSSYGTEQININKYNRSKNE